MKFYILLFSLVAAFAFTSCGDNCDANTYSSEVSRQSIEVSTAASAYSAAPEDNALCADYAAELEALIAIYEEYQGCDDINVGGSLDDGIATTQASIDALDCN